MQYPVPKIYVNQAEGAIAERVTLPNGSYTPTGGGLPEVSRPLGGWGS